MKRKEIITLCFSKIFLGKDQGFMYEVRMGSRVESRNLSDRESIFRTICLVVEQVLPRLDNMCFLPEEHDLRIKFNQEFKGSGRINCSKATSRGNISKLLISVPFSEEEIKVIYEALSVATYDFFSFSK